MTDTEADPKGAQDPRAEETGAESSSRLKQYRERTDEWAAALRDGAEQHAPPEVLGGLAKAAKNVAQYLEDMAERARAKQAKEKLPEPGEQAPEPAEQAPRATEQGPEPKEQAQSAPKD